MFTKMISVKSPLDLETFQWKDSGMDRLKLSEKHAKQCKKERSSAENGGLGADNRLIRPPVTSRQCTLSSQIA